MNYPLKDVAEFTTDGSHGEDLTGLLVYCPNCGAAGGAWFKNPIHASYQRLVEPVWEREGETLETLSLHPSWRMIGHFHAWILKGELLIDTPFTCQRSVVSDAA